LRSQTRVPSSTGSKGVGVDGLVLGLALVHERLDQPVRAVDLEVGAAEGELLAVGRMMDEAVAPAKPSIETDISRISLRPLMTPPASAGA
jgi:hypothetical protein